MHQIVYYFLPCIALGVHVNKTIVLVRSKILRSLLFFPAAFQTKEDVMAEVTGYLHEIHKPCHCTPTNKQIFCVHPWIITPFMIVYYILYFEQSMNFIEIFIHSHLFGTFYGFYCHFYLHLFTSKGNSLDLSMPESLMLVC